MRSKPTYARDAVSSAYAINSSATLVASISPWNVFVTRVLVRRAPRPSSHGCSSHESMSKVPDAIVWIVGSPVTLRRRAALPTDRAMVQREEAAPQPPLPDQAVSHAARQA